MAKQAKADAPAADEAQVLRLEREFAAPVERVFQAWTEKAALVEWFGPDGFTVPSCEMEVRSGGAYRLCMRSPAGEDHWVRGTYREVAPPHRLVFTWAWESGGAPGPETLVTVELARGEGTLLRLTHATFETAESRDSHAQGWTSSFDCLARAFGEGAIP